VRVISPVVVELGIEGKRHTVHATQIKKYYPPEGVCPGSVPDWESEDSEEEEQSLEQEEEDDDQHNANIVLQVQNPILPLPSGAAQGQRIVAFPCPQ